MDNKVLQQHISPLVPYFLDSSAISTNTTYVLTPQQKTVRVTGDAGSVTSIQLPPAVEMPGQIVSIKLIAAAAGGVKIVDSAANDLVGDNLEDSGDYAILYSDGIDWTVLVEQSNIA